MKLSVWMRKVHNWGSIAVALPVGVIIGSGVFLQLKKEVAWIQPPTSRGVGQVPVVSFERVLEAARAIPEARIGGWEDVDRLDVRPGRGVVKVRPKHSGWEVQVDLVTGEVLRTALRRSDVIESIHDGSWFHPNVKLWVFLPAAVGLFVLWVTGLYMFVYPYWRRRRVVPRRAPGGGGPR